ncbi:hypothetical protein FSW04_19495 [Baekduia soli]|uniref:SGNH domain-containing protein n=1 Tax=Baekduia soli TaxID=496014 RepID=A0A5B8U8S0_9ACTN|nr:SGNH hydrolase domain-containing protein [Baekduia soli]QEC49539.1 hypothetical protein FSW04_19495 [Baekduia soli]
MLTVIAAALSGRISHVQARTPASAAPTTAQQISDAERQACFGAATRDPGRPCVNARLRTEVVPDPGQAPTLPNTPCTLVAGSPDVCEFGVAADRATQTVALVGDSHAGHWRGALEVVARAHRWHGVSITHTSCPLSKAVRNLSGQDRFGACVRWKREVFGWFHRHPEIHTIFVAGLSGGVGVFPSAGRTRFETSVAGYRAAWRALPRSVHHIVVIRDTPKMRWTTNACVARAAAQGRAPGTACAVPRSARLDPDPLVTAARRLHSPRVQVVDLTRLFCGESSCYPVIGGALVFRDENHMTAVFSATLGPFLRRAVDGLMAGWRS